MEINTSNVPMVRVGVMNEPKVKFIFNGEFKIGDTIVEGEEEAECSNGKIMWNGSLHDDLLFVPVDEEHGSFTLCDVTIGVSFHWRRQENQTFKGALHLIVEDERITTINVLPIEDYLLSVISSEMSATASLELLKAHAVISRSWLLAQIQAHNAEQAAKRDSADYLSPTLRVADGADDNELIKWWDHDDHVNFDVCADDHCQRYQGITRASTEAVKNAIEATWGQVLMSHGELCDARFSKSCGGVLEQFENCWEDHHYTYLEARRDGENETEFPDLTKEAAAEEWIMSKPKAFCNTSDKAILSQVLNDYDQETTDFYRWKVEYSQAQLSDLIRRRTGVDYGRIKDLQPVARGTSGRLYKMKIVGEKLTRVIGKELAIRYALSESALYSSAFVVETGEKDSDGYPTRFVLRGAGWGHGVGLCQIGAAVMGAKGYGYKEILFHYFVGAKIEKEY
ncbi:MAG: SpoIID/LytB domain-containing protein [Muribaculaceae bacterium]|nr:SpoIID/LytB domain-containing protein [Muribaculaceae bacterium]